MRTYSYLALLTLLLAPGATSQEPNRPAAPSPMSAPGVTAQPTAIRPHSVQLKWTATVTKDIDGYYVYRAEGGLGAGYERITPLPVKLTEYTDTTVRADKIYVYAISAVQTIGHTVRESSFSPSVTARIPSP